MIANIGQLLLIRQCFLKYQCFGLWYYNLFWVDIFIKIYELGNK